MSCGPASNTGQHLTLGKETLMHEFMARNPWIVTLEDILELGRENSLSFKNLAEEL